MQPMWFLLACTDTVQKGPINPQSDLDARVQLGDVRSCDVPSETVRYVDMALSQRLREPGVPITNHEESASTVASDFNRDGLIDLAIFFTPGLKNIYLQRTDGFETVNFPELLTGPGLSLADVNRDGYTDILVGGQTPEALINTDAGLLPQFLPDLGFVQEGAVDFVHDLSPGDLDGDGELDLYLGVTRNSDDQDFPFSDLLLSMQDDGQLLIDTTSIGPEIGERHTFDVLWFDVDGDADLDVYLANDLGAVLGASTLLRNDNGTLVDAAESCTCSTLTNAKGVDIDDYNRDGLPDIYLSGNPRNSLLQQLEDGSFVDVTVSVHAEGVTEPATGWGAVFLDYDNDGQRDILSAQGDRWNEGNTFPHFDIAFQLLRQDAGVFSDVAPALGLDVLASYRTALPVDLNQDGIEDFLVTTVDSLPRLYLSQGCTANGWVEVEAPIGSRVEVRAGDLVQVGWVHPDQGYMSARDPYLHFGLGSAQEIDGMTITFPGGEVLDVTEVIPARRRITVQGDR